MTVTKMQLTPRRLAMLRYLIDSPLVLGSRGTRPWVEVVRVQGELHGRFTMADEQEEIPSSAMRDCQLLRHGGLIRRVRTVVDGRVTYPFTVTSAGLAAAVAAQVRRPPDAIHQLDMLQSQPELVRTK